MENNIWHKPSDIPAFGASVALIIETRLPENMGHHKDIMVRHIKDNEHYDQICRWENVLAWSYTINLIPEEIGI